jgi:hypothetical protein
MATYKTTKRLADRDAAYLAGLVDGEGTITLTRKHRGDNRQLCVSLSSTERKVLEWVVETVGSGQITNKRTYSQRHAASYTYQVYNRQALDLLVQLFPYLKTYRRERAELVLRMYKSLTPRNGRYSAHQVQAREEFVEKFFAITSTSRPAQQWAGENGAHIGEA